MVRTYTNKENVSQEDIQQIINNFSYEKNFENIKEMIKELLYRKDINTFKKTYLTNIMKLQIEQIKNETIKNKIYSYFI